MDFYWHLYSETANWLRFADAKIGGIIAGNALLLVLISKPLEVALQPPAPGAVHPYVWLLILTLVSVAASILFALLAIRPRPTAVQSQSLVYFMSIAKRYSAEKYREDFGESSEVQREADMIGQIWELSVLADKKYRSISRSCLGLIVAVFCAFLRMILCIN